MATVPTFQWYRGTTKLTGANTAEYTITREDLGKVLSVRVSGSKAGYIEANTAGIKTEAELGIWPENAGSEPQLSENVYQSGTAAELKWFLNRVNAGETSLSAKLTKEMCIRVRIVSGISRFAIRIPAGRVIIVHIEEYHIVPIF